MRPGIRIRAALSTDARVNVTERCSAMLEANGSVVIPGWTPDKRRPREPHVEPQVGGAARFDAAVFGNPAAERTALRLSPHEHETEVWPW